MTELIEDERALAKRDDRMVLANHCALAAGRTLRVIDARHAYCDVASSIQRRFEKQVRVRSFDIAIHKDRRVMSFRAPCPAGEAERQARCNGGLAGAALAARNDDPQ